MGCVAVSDPRRVRKNAVEDESGKTAMKEEIVSLVLGSEGDEELLIHAAIQRNNYPFVKQLLATQSNINVLDKNGYLSHFSLVSSIFTNPFKECLQF